MNFKNINFKFLPIENYTFKSKLSANELIKIIQPDFLVKGGDYKANEIVKINLGSY